MNSASKKIAVIGGGGLGIELIGYLMTTYSDSEIGIIDRNPTAEAFEFYSSQRNLGTDARCVPDKGDWEFYIAVGEPTRREAIYNLILADGLRVGTYIHPSCYLGPKTSIGPGCVIGPNAIINSGASIGNNALINVACSVGHSAKVGSHSVLSPFTSLSGSSAVGDRCFLGTRATLFPGVTIGDDCMVDAHSCVRASTENRKIISNRSKYLVLDRRV